jgi:hypothetical protein
MVASVGNPPWINRSGVGAWATSSVQARQAYFGRRVTIILANLKRSRCDQHFQRRTFLASTLICSMKRIGERGYLWENIDVDSLAAGPSTQPMDEARQSKCERWTLLASRREADQ